MSIAPINPIASPEFLGIAGIERSPAKPDLAGSFGKALMDAHAAEHVENEVFAVRRRVSPRTAS